MSNTPINNCILQNLPASLTYLNINECIGVNVEKGEHAFSHTFSVY